MLTSGQFVLEVGWWFVNFVFSLQGSKYYNWNTHEPNNLGTENCVEMNFMNHAGKWNDRRCSTLVRFICQKTASKNYLKDSWFLQIKDRPLQKSVLRSLIVLYKLWYSFYNSLFDFNQQLISTHVYTRCKIFKKGFL